MTAVAPVRHGDTSNSDADEGLKTASETNAALDALVLRNDDRQGERVIEAIYRFLGRFVSYPSEHAHVAHALWIIHTHMMLIWDSTPRLAFLSAEPASGKTRALEITDLLVPNPVSTVNVSAAYLVRKVGSDEGATILFDEIDTVFGPKAKENEDIRGLLNAGHRKGATAGRCVVRGREVVTEEIPAYAAVALAGIGWLPETLLSRSIIIRMRRRRVNERVEAFRRRLHEKDGWRIRDQIATWAGANSGRIDFPHLPSQITDRDADIWEPLVAIGDAIGGDWPGRARKAGIALVSASKEVEPSLGIRLLTDLRLAFGSAEAIPSKSLLQALHEMAEAPWSSMHGKPLDERGLAQRLRQYGIKSKTIRIGDATPRGYQRTDLEDVWARYLPPSPPASATSATSATKPKRPGTKAIDRDAAPPRNMERVSDVADVAAPGRDGRVCAHCRRGGGLFCEASVGGEPITLHVGCKDAFRP